MEETIGSDFMEMTKYPHLGPSLQSQGVPPPTLEVPVPEDAALIDLPPAASLPPITVNLLGLIEKRESLRQYTQDPLSLEELTMLLWGTQGVRYMDQKLKVIKQNVPSAGSRHPFETFLLVNRVEGLEPGLYRYLGIPHKLARLVHSGDVNAALTDACLGQKQVQTSAVTFIWAAVPLRTVWRYSQRGYRYIHLDAGHVCQNLYLIAEAIGCGGCAIAAFDDNQVNAILGLDGQDMFVIYLASLGKR